MEEIYSLFAVRSTIMKRKYKINCMKCKVLSNLTFPLPSTWSYVETDGEIMSCWNMNQSNAALCRLLM